MSLCLSSYETLPYILKLETDRLSQLFHLVESCQCYLFYSVGRRILIRMELESKLAICLLNLLIRGILLDL